MFRLLLAIPTYILFILLVFIPLCLLGWILVPIAMLFKAYYKTESKDGVGNPRIDYHFTWKLMFPWDNYEDGIANDTYWKAPNLFLQTIYWTCIRNPVNNLRIVPYLSCKINPKKIKFFGTFGSSNLFHYEELKKYDTKVPHYFFAWQGIYSNIFWQFNLNGKLKRLWIGWKIFPTDVFGVTKYRQKGAGFAIQWKDV